MISRENGGAPVRLPTLVCKGLVLILAADLSQIVRRVSCFQNQCDRGLCTSLYMLP